MTDRTGGPGGAAEQLRRPTLRELRDQAREHARQLDAVRFVTVQQLADRWGISEDAVRDVPRAQLPYLLFGRSRMRRYDPRDVERYEETQKQHDGDSAAPGT